MNTKLTSAGMRAAFEAALPLGDVSARGYTFEQKRKAVRRVMFEHWSYRRAGRECGADGKTVAKWVGDTEERLRLAQEAAA